MNDSIVRAFLAVTVLWGVVALLVGLIAALELAFDVGRVNGAADVLDRSFGRAASQTEHRVSITGLGTSSSLINSGRCSMRVGNDQGTAGEHRLSAIASGHLPSPTLEDPLDMCQRRFVEFQLVSCCRGQRGSRGALRAMARHTSAATVAL